MSDSVAALPENRSLTSGGWHLVATFDPTDLVVIAYGSDPASTPSNRGFQRVERLPFPPEIRRNLVVIPVMKAIASAQDEKADLTHRGQKWTSIARPVTSGTGHVHAVWVWVGLAGESAPSHVATGAWEWRLDGDAFAAIYGPGIPDIYGHPEWVVGSEYPVHETVDNAVVVQQSESARFLEEQQVGSRHRLRLAIRRQGRGEVADLAMLQAATQIIKRDDHLLWVGVTWDVTLYDHPEQIAEYAAFGVLMKDMDGWVATAVWDDVWSAPVQIVRWFNHKVPEQFWVDAVTKRFRVHPSDRGLIRRWTRTLDQAGSAGRLEGELRVWGVDERWHEVSVDVARIQGARPSSAVVRVTDTDRS